MPQEKVRETASIEEKLRKRSSSGERANKMRAGTARVLRNFVPHVGSELPRDFEQVVRGKQEKCTGNTRQERQRKRERRNPEKEKSDAFDENHVGMRSSLAQGFRRGVFGRIPPFAGDFGGRKFDDDDAALGPIPFQNFHLAAADDEAATEFFDRGEDGFAIVLITDGIVDFDADEDVGRHFGRSWEERWRKLNAETQSAQRKKEREERTKEEERKRKTR